MASDRFLSRTGRAASAVLLTLFLSLQFFACSSDDGSKNDPAPVPDPEPVTVTVSFDRNGGTGNFMAPVTFTAGVPQALPECTFTAPAKMEFAGWALTSDGTKAYDDKEIITLDGSVSELALFALWKIKYVSFTAEEEGSSFKLVHAFPAVPMFQMTDPPQLEYSADGCETWTDMTIGTDVVLAEAGDVVYIKAKSGVTNAGFSDPLSTMKSVYFSMTGKIAAAGNLLTLLNEDCTSSELSSAGAFYQLFKNCAALTSAPELRASSLSASCYQSMFEGCTSLENPPVLPAADLAASCYKQMFSGCTSLKTAPALPAVHMQNQCYAYMFFNCSALAVPPALNAPELAESCYQNMFSNSGIETAPALPAEILYKGCDPDFNPLNVYQAMFSGCKNLNVFPELNSTTLSNGCYMQMFESCPNLETAPALKVTELKENCYNGMFSGCKNLKSAPELKAVNLKPGCYASLFKNCTSLETAPDLPAKEAAANCYNGMFSGCTALKSVPFKLEAETLAVNCYNSMFSGCTALETAPVISASVMAQDCCFAMFSGCSALAAAPALPAETLAPSCYSQMFFMCTSLVSAPAVLPAAALASQCYGNMFNGCTALQNGPEIMASAIADNSNSLFNMFRGCTSLNSVKVHFSAWGTKTVTNWMYGVSSAGTFTCPAALAQTFGESGIPTGWTVVTF